MLVSARLTGRNLFAGESFTVPVSIVNDAEDGKTLAGGRLKWRFMVDGKTLSQGELATPAVDYYTNKKMEVKLTVPDRMLAGRADALLCFDLEINGKVISSNHYAYRIAEKAWAAQPAKSVKGSVVVYNASDLSKSLFEALGG